MMRLSAACEQTIMNLVVSLQQMLDVRLSVGHSNRTLDRSRTRSVEKINVTRVFVDSRKIAYDDITHVLNVIYCLFN